MTTTTSVSLSSIPSSPKTTAYPLPLFLAIIHAAFSVGPRSKGKSKTKSLTKKYMPRVFKCLEEDCLPPNTFKSPEQLKAHYQKQHRKILPYLKCVCDCQARTRTREEMKFHKKSCSLKGTKIGKLKDDAKLNRPALKKGEEDIEEEKNEQEEEDMAEEQMIKDLFHS